MCASLSTWSCAGDSTERSSSYTRCASSGLSSYASTSRATTRSDSSSGSHSAPWSETYYERLHVVLQEENFAARREETGASTVREFTLVDCGADIDRAMHLVEVIFLRVFRSGDGVRVGIRAVDISPMDEFVRDMNRRPWGESEWRG